MPRHPHNNIFQLSLGWLKYHVLTKKFNTPIGFVFIALAGILVAFLTVKFGAIGGLALAGAAIGVLATAVCFTYPVYGYYFAIILSSLQFIPPRFVGAAMPLGLIIEAVTYIVLAGIIAQQYKERQNVSMLWKHPISIIFLVIICYYVIELFNPNMHSKEGWVNFFRKQLSFLVFFYISYLLLNSYERIKGFLKFWFILAIIAAIYGVKQQWLGFFPFEINWVLSDDRRAELYFQAGMFRKFSFLSDPATFGMLCASMAVFSLILWIRTPKQKKTLRKRLIRTSLLLLIASSYSGTRTCNLMIISGIVMYILFTINEKKTFNFLIGSVLTGLFLLFGPFKDNPVIFRIRTTFEGSKDPSAALRDQNRKFIQPYMQTHPIGGGISTAGSEGATYNPNHFLAPVQPDSGYIKVVLEQGWIGLLLMLLFYFFIMQTGIKNFYRATNPEIKAIYIGITICLFTLMVGQYAQVGIGQYPQILFFYPVLIILIKLIDYDTPNTETQNI